MVCTRWRSSAFPSSPRRREVGSFLPRQFAIARELSPCGSLRESREVGEVARGFAEPRGREVFARFRGVREVAYFMRLHRASEVVQLGAVDCLGRGNRLNWGRLSCGTR